MMFAGIDRAPGGPFAGPADASVTVNLPSGFSPNYSVYAYFASDGSSFVNEGYQVGSQQFWASVTPTTAGFSSFLQATGTTSATATPGANYAVFSNLTGSSFTLSAIPGPGGGSPNANAAWRAELMGLQIVGVAVPEPSSLALLGAGLAIAGIGLHRHSACRRTTR